MDNLINQNQDIVFYKDELSKSSTYAKIAQVQKEENRKLKDIRWIIISEGSDKNGK